MPVETDLPAEFAQDEESRHRNSQSKFKVLLQLRNIFNWKNAMFRVEAGRSNNGAAGTLGTLRATPGRVLLSHVLDVNPPRHSAALRVAPDILLVALQ